MPCGGPQAARWNRLFETDRPEYLDCPETSPTRIRRVLRGLDRFQRITLGYRTYSRLVLAQVRDVPEPRVLELGAGHGQLARRLLDQHPRAHVTVSDNNAQVVETVRRALGGIRLAHQARHAPTCAQLDDGGTHSCPFTTAYAQQSVRTFRP